MYFIQPENNSLLYGDEGFVTQTAVENRLRQWGWVQKGPVTWELPEAPMVVQIIRVHNTTVAFFDVGELPKGKRQKEDDDLVGNFYTKHFQTI